MRFGIVYSQKGNGEARISIYSIDEISEIRIIEQQNAASYIGVKSVEFLGEMDGELLPSLKLRKEIVKLYKAICAPNNCDE